MSSPSQEMIKVGLIFEIRNDIVSIIRVSPDVTDMVVDEWRTVAGV